MNERRKRVMKRLVVEELERREMLTGGALTNNSLELASLSFATDDGQPEGPESGAPKATSGVGQQTITTGANTPGIGSFATPTAGPSKAGGTGNPNMPGADDLAALDQALEELLGEFEDLTAAKPQRDVAAIDAKPTATAPVMVGAKPAAPRAWSMAADELLTDDADSARAATDR